MIGSRMNNKLLEVAGVEIEVVEPEHTADGYWYVYVSGHPGVFGRGRNRDAAIGELMRIHGGDLWERKGAG